MRGVSTPKGSYYFGSTEEKVRTTQQYVRLGDTKAFAQQVLQKDSGGVKRGDFAKPTGGRETTVI